MGRREDAQREYKRVRELLFGYATPLIAEVVRVSDLLDDSDGALTALAGEALQFVLTLPADVVPTELPTSLRARLAVLATGAADVGEDELRELIHTAFTIAGVFISRSSFASRVSPAAMNYFVEVVRALEGLVLEVVLESAGRERVRLEHRDRYVQAGALYEVVADPAVVAIADADLIESGEDPAALSDPAAARSLDEVGPVVAVVVRALSAEATIPHLRDLPGPSLSALSASESIVLLPESLAGELGDRVAELFGDSVATVGLPVAITDVARSLDWSRRAQTLRQVFDLRELGAASGSRVIACADIPITMLIGADRQLLDLLRDQVLRPFRGLSEFRRTILLETLDAWARHPGAGAPAIARVLGKHPQTIRYRLRQLRELLGDDLDDPQRLLLIRVIFALAPR